MNIRETIEQNEINNLSKFATKSKYSLGREVNEEYDNLRTCFAQDRDRNSALVKLMHLYFKILLI